MNKILLIICLLSYTNILNAQEVFFKEVTIKSNILKEALNEYYKDIEKYNFGWIALRSENCDDDTTSISIYYHNYSFRNIKNNFPKYITQHNDKLIVIYSICSKFIEEKTNLSKIQFINLVDKQLSNPQIISLNDTIIDSFFRPDEFVDIYSDKIIICDNKFKLIKYKP